MHDDSNRGRQTFQSILHFSHLLIRELIKGLSPNYAIFITFPIDICNYIVHNGSTPLENSIESIFKFQHLLIWRVIKGLSPN